MNSPEKSYFEPSFPEKAVSGGCDRRTSSFGILKGVDANFHHIMKLFCDQKQDRSDVNHDKVVKSLTMTIQFQGACIVKVIRDEVDFLEQNRKSFPDDFVDQNVTSYQYWEEYFSLVGSKPFTTSATSYVLATLESFMLFKEFYWSVDSVLKTWPIPVGYSFPRLSDKMDLFFDRIEAPPHIAYSLAFRPRFDNREMKSLIVAEYQKASCYLSRHLKTVEEAMSLLNLEGSSEYLRKKIEKLVRRTFLPIENKLIEYSWKCKEIEKCDYRMELLQMERVYASEQILESYQHLRTLNKHIQKKMAKYLAVFYLNVKNKLSEERTIIRTCFLCQTVSKDQHTTKNLTLNMLLKWEDTLGDVINLNRNGVLEVITNVNDLEAEMASYMHFLKSDNISINCF